MTQSDRRWIKEGVLAAIRTIRSLGQFTRIGYTSQFEANLAARFAHRQGLSAWVDHHHYSDIDLHVYTLRSNHVGRYTVDPFPVRRSA